MKIGTACAIFLQINSEKYTDEEKGTAILEVLKMPTHNGISKSAMLEVIGYLLNLAFDVPEEARWRTMPKMTVRVILKSGVEFSIKCDKFTLTRNGFQQVTGYNIEGITENKPVYLDFEQVAAVVRVFADEKLETDDAPEEKRLFTETPMKCPFCEGENSNARVYEDKQNKEYFVYCQKCGVETKDTFTSKAKAVKAFTEGKTKKVTGSEVADE